MSQVNTSSLQTFEMLISEGDDVLIESPTYSGVISAVCLCIFYFCVFVFLSLFWLLYRLF